MAEVQHVTVSRSDVRVVILVLAAIVVLACGIAILLSQKHIIGETGTGFIAAAVGLAALAL